MKQREMHCGVRGTTYEEDGKWSFFAEIYAREADSDDVVATEVEREGGFLTRDAALTALRKVCKSLNEHIHETVAEFGLPIIRTEEKGSHKLNEVQDNGLH